MSSVVTTNTNSNVTYCSSKQENDNQLTYLSNQNQILTNHHHHHYHHNRGLHEKSCNQKIVIHHNHNQNSDPESQIDISKKNLSSVGSTSLSATGNSLVGSHCHCLTQQQQQQPLQQQSSNCHLANSAATNQSELKANFNTGSTSLSNCQTVIKSNFHNNNTTTTTTYNKGIKRPNDSVEQTTPVIISAASSHQHPIAGRQVIPTPNSGNNHQSPDSSFVGTQNQAENSIEGGGGTIEEEGCDDDDDDDLMDEDESIFDYEPVLTKILNEKKLALSNSPDVIKFLAGFQQYQKQRPT